MCQFKNSAFVVASAASLLGACAGANGAIMISSNASAGVGNVASTFTGSVDYVPQTATTGQLTVVLTNTSDVALNARLTAFVFNVGDATTPSSTLLSAVGPTLSNISNGSAQPFGSSFVGGAGTGGQFEGGGNPANGLAPGEVGTFTFRITSTSAPTLTAADFFRGPYDQNFVVRFRGLSDGSSSKIPAAHAPSPGAGALALLGLAAVGTRRRR